MNISHRSRVVSSAACIFLWQSCRSSLHLISSECHHVVQTEGAAKVARRQSLWDLDLSGQVRDLQLTRQIQFISAPTLFSLTVFSVLLVLKIEGYLLPASVSWFLVFAPLFICDGLNAYFCIIVFIRQYLESQFRVALLRALWSLFVIGTDDRIKVFQMLRLMFSQDCCLCSSFCCVTSWRMWASWTTARWWARCSSCCSWSWSERVSSIKTVLLLWNKFTIFSCEEG